MQFQFSSSKCEGFASNRQPNRVPRPAYVRGLYHLKAARCPRNSSLSSLSSHLTTAPASGTMGQSPRAHAPSRAGIQSRARQRYAWPGLLAALYVWPPSDSPPSCCNCMHYDCVFSLHPAFPWADGCMRGAPAQTASAALSTTTSHGPGTMAGAGLAKAPLTRKNLCCSSPGRAVAAFHQL